MADMAAPIARRNPATIFLWCAWACALYFVVGAATLRVSYPPIPFFVLTIRGVAVVGGVLAMLFLLQARSRYAVAGGVAALLANIGLYAYGGPKFESSFAHLAPPCRAAAGFAPLDFPELSAIKKKERREKSQYLGECQAKKITDVLWFVSGIHYNSWMKEDGRSPVRYEAVMYEDNDASNLYVERYGTQYT